MRIKLKIDFQAHKKGDIIEAINCGKDWLVGCNTAKLLLPDGTFSSHIAEYYDYEALEESPKGAGQTT